MLRLVLCIQPVLRLYNLTTSAVLQPVLLLKGAGFRSFCAALFDIDSHKASSPRFTLECLLSVLATDLIHIHAQCRLMKRIVKNSLPQVVAKQAGHWHHTYTNKSR
jgi:hypothetical protein